MHDTFGRTLELRWRTGPSRLLDHGAEKTGRHEQFPMDSQVMCTLSSAGLSFFTSDLVMTEAFSKLDVQMSYYRNAVRLPHSFLL